MAPIERPPERVLAVEADAMGDARDAGSRSDQVIACGVEAKGLYVLPGNDPEHRLETSIELPQALL